MSIGVGRARGGRGGTMGRAREVLLEAQDIESALPGMHMAAEEVAATKASAAQQPRHHSKSTVIVEDDPVLGTLKISDDRLTGILLSLLAVAVLLLAFIVGKSFIDAPAAGQ